jgi:hypothetical protein
MSGSDAKPLQVNRCSVDSITLYEITEQELELLEQGSPSSTLLNFAIFAWSVGFAFLTTLLTVKLTDKPIFIVFVVLTALGIFSGVVLLVVWARMAKSTSGVVIKIKSRAVVTPDASSVEILAVTLPEPPGPAQAG